MTEWAWNPYATYGPNDDTGRSWAEYFRDYHDQREASDHDDMEQEVLVILSQVTGDDLSGYPPLFSRLYQNALKVSENGAHGRSWAYVPGGVFKSGEREGQFRPDKILTTWWFGARINGTVLKVAYRKESTWIGTDKTTCILRNYGWDMISDKQMKELIS